MLTCKKEKTITKEYLTNYYLNFDINELSIKNKDKKKIKIMSLFSGCGGMDLGFLLSENNRFFFDITWANDYEASACKTFKENFKHDIVCDDIWNYDLNNTPKIDIIIGGFPCQDFSILRGDKRSGFNSKRGLLYTKFVEAVELKQPLFFIAENVKGLLTSHKGWAIKKIKEDFSAISPFGYNVQHKLINFANFGVPQNRERIVIIGVRRDLDIHFEFPEETNKNDHMTVKTAFSSVENAKYNNEKLRMLQSTKDKLKHIPPGGNYKYIPEHNFRNWMSLIYKRTHPNKPSPTIVACGGGGTWGYHFKKLRSLTNRERARIQTFPDSFVFYGTTTEIRKQIGNAVPPLGIKPIGEKILESIKKYNININ